MLLPNKGAEHAIILFSPFNQAINFEGKKNNIYQQKDDWIQTI